MPAPTDSVKADHMFSDDIKFLQKVIIFHPTDDRFIALKRSPSDRNRPDKWDLPGGNVGFGEKHDESLRREIDEETSVEVVTIYPVQVVTNYIDSIYYLFIGYKTKAKSDKVVLSDELTEYKWVTKEEFIKLDSADFLIDLVNML